MKRDHFSFTVLAMFAWLLIFCLGSISSANGAHPPDPTEQFRPFVEKMISILTDPDQQGDEKRMQRRENAMTAASEHFDFHEMSKRVLGTTWRKLNHDEQEHFVTLFIKLLEHVYIGKIERYSKQEIVFKDQIIRGDRAQIITDVVDREGVISVFYILMLKEDVWMAYDIVLEGVSLVRNYMEQFREILREEEFTFLLTRIENKIIELEESGKKTNAEALPQNKTTDSSL